MYESIYKALQKIRNKKDRADAYDAICAYALYNKEPDLETTSDAVSIAFELTRPVLDSARKKAASGKKGGSKVEANGKQDVSKTEAKCKQPAREKEKEEEIEKEKEKEKENENEIEIEKESLFLSAGGGDTRARMASEEELSLIGLNPGEYPFVTSETVQSVMDAAAFLFRKYFSREPTAMDCRMVFTSSPPGCYELLDYAFESAAIAGKLNDWRYIRGIMDRLAARGIQTPQQAREWDEIRPDKGE